MNGGVSVQNDIQSWKYDVASIQIDHAFQKNGLAFTQIDIVFKLNGVVSIPNLFLIEMNSVESRVKAINSLPSAVTSIKTAVVLDPRVLALASCPVGCASQNIRVQRGCRDRVRNERRGTAIKCRPTETMRKQA